MPSTPHAGSFADCTVPSCVVMRDLYGARARPADHNDNGAVIADPLDKLTPGERDMLFTLMARIQRRHVCRAIALTAAVVIAAYEIDRRIGRGR